MDAYKVYNNIKKQHQEALAIGDKIIAKFQREYPYVCFPAQYDSLMKIFSLIETGFGEVIWPMLEENGYCFEPEIQFMLANLDMVLRNCQSVYCFPGWRMFYSFENICKIQNKYILDTKGGTIITTPLLEYSEDAKVQAYSFLRSYYGFCHDSVERFLRFNPEYQAVTSLIPDQFGKQQYYSYISHDGKIIDIAHGACIEEDNYNEIMKPVPLNSVYGYELEEETQKLDGNEIGPEKSLLVRLAVAKQRKM